MSAVEKAIDRARKANSTKLTAVELKEIIQPSFASVHEPADMTFYELHMLFPFGQMVWCPRVKYRFWFSSFFLDALPASLCIFIPLDRELEA